MIYTICLPVKINCVVPEIIHTSHMEGIFPQTPPPHPSGNSSQASYIYLNFGAFENPPPPRNFQFLLWEGYGYFLELHIRVSYALNLAFEKHGD